MADAYLSRGVSSTKDDVHRAIKNTDKGEFGGAFCKLIADPFGSSDYCAAMHADGAGTKSSLAYIKYNETGDFSVYADIAQDSIVMNLDDLLCVGATDNFVMSNTIGRNAHRVDGNAIKAVIDGYLDFLTRMRAYGINVVMSGGETADVGDIVSTLIVDSTLFVRIKREDVIDCDNIKDGDAIIGFASFGKSVYEKKYNSGIGSNGLTAARHLLLSKYYAEKYPETYSNTIDISKVYCGKYKLDDILPGSDMSVGDAILSPTRTYAPVVKEVLSAFRNDIHGIIHCTGGGQVKCRNFGNGIHYVKNSLFDTPPLFKAISENSDIGMKEMYQVFNMGHRLEMYCPKEKAEDIIKISEKYGIEAKIVGYVEKSGGTNTVTIDTKEGHFEY